MTDRAARLAMLLGLVPLTVAVFVVMLVLLDGGNPPIHPLRGASFVSTCIICITCIAVWRRYVHWSRPRASFTVIFTLLVLGQVALWKPLWSLSNCGQEDVLRVGQSSSAAGFWCAGCALIWWGGLLGKRAITHISRTSGSFRMSADAVRLSIGLGLLPLLFGTFWVTGSAIDRWLPGVQERLTLCIAYAVPACIAVLVWWLLWRKQVAWTAHRRLVTIALAATLLLSPVVLLIDGLSGVPEAVQMTFPLFACAAWFAGTARVWYTPSISAIRSDATSAAEFEQVLRCPQCQYSLIGLREVRCPECGWASTVDQVVRSSLTQFTDAGPGTV